MGAGEKLQRGLSHERLETQLPAWRRRCDRVTDDAADGADIRGGHDREQFVYDWTETSGSHVGLTGMVDFTLGASDTSKPGFFTLASFTVTQSTGFCGICSPLTETLTGALFDSTTGG